MGNSPRTARGATNEEKHPQGPVHGVHPHHGPQRVLDEVGDAHEQPRITSLGIGANGDRSDGEVSFSGLDHRFDGVAERRYDVESDGGFAGEGSKAAHGIRYPDPGEFSHHAAAEPWRDFFAGEMFDFVGLAVADHDVRGAVRSAAPIRDVSPPYWLSPSVFTMMSAPCLRQASMPFGSSGQGPGCACFVRYGRRRSCAIPTVLLVLPLSMIRISMTSIPAIVRWDSLNRFGEGLFLVVAGDLDDKLQKERSNGRGRRRPDYTEIRWWRCRGGQAVKRQNRIGRQERGGSRRRPGGHSVSCSDGRTMINPHCRPDPRSVLR